MNYIGTQNFETKRCFLRRIKLSDYTMMYENWAKYDEVCRYYPFNPVDDIEIYRDKVKHWISNYESDSYFHWVIEWKETGELIGTINLGNVEEACHMCDTCYMLSPGFWNKGIMTEVLEAVLDYAFDRVGFNRVQAEVFYGNDASSAVLKKCGMVLEGIARKNTIKMVSISILLYGQLLQVIGYIETRTDIKYDEKEDVVNMCKAQDDHKKLGIQEGIQQGRCLEIYSLVQDGILEPEVGASRVSMSLDDFADAM